MFRHASRIGSWLLSALLLLGFISSALADATPNAPVNASATLTVDEHWNGRGVELLARDGLVITLPCQPGTGYGWQLRGGTPPPILVLESNELVDSRGLPGGEERDQLTFRVKADAVAGRGARLFLDYVRPWEHGSPPAKVFELRLRVLAP
jgi:inhibitor of cysteine peptidase